MRVLDWIATLSADDHLLDSQNDWLFARIVRLMFNLVAEAQRAADSGQVDRIHNIILASAGIPGAFPFRMIDDGLYVDGASRETSSTAGEH